MSDENKQENKDYDRWAVSPDFQKFLATIFASFVGCLVAICLYNASVGLNVRCSCPMPMPRYDVPMYYGGEFAPDCPYKKHKMYPAKKHELKDTAKKVPAQEKAKK